MKRRHNMPFGAECRDDGSVRFRLWAPAARQVEVSLSWGNKSVLLPMVSGNEGWFELNTDAARKGSQYYFRIDGERQVPDPASRFQPSDVHGPSEVVDPEAFEWQDSAWRGRRWEEAVTYELHVGTFTESGAFAGVNERLDYLLDIGITALELMPVADFAGSRNWGYDGVFPFAPDSIYGRPEDLKQLVQSAHDRGLMIFLDVVYNHFGPEGNYLRAYAPQFFTDRHCTPWGDAINFENRVVRDFFIHNALYWLTEYHFDGLRLDAVHAIMDDSRPDILTELAETVRQKIGGERHVHLILENDRNQARYLQRTRNCQPAAYTAQWNDDFHHAMHVLTTGEKEAYYSDYSESPLAQLGRCLTEGFAYQGENSIYRKGAARGEASAALPPPAFVNFLQNHDQVGNRAFGERMSSIIPPRVMRAALAILLLAPSPPLLFMGEEFAAESPFLFFCEFENDLAAAVTTGRRNEFAHFKAFSDPAKREQIPDPNAATTFQASRLNWNSIRQPDHLEWINFYKRLLRLRSDYIVPMISSGCANKADYETHGDRGLTAHWQFPQGASLGLLANLGGESLSELRPSRSRIIYASEEVNKNNLEIGTLPPWSVAWIIET